MHEYVHDILVDLTGQTVLRPPRKYDKLYSEQGHQDQGGSHRLHVHVGLCSVSVSQLRHQHSYDIQQEEEVNLRQRRFCVQTNVTLRQKLWITTKI